MGNVILHKIRHGFFRLSIYIVCMSGLAGLSACKEKPQTADEIYQNDASGVVLIKNDFYYTLSFAGSVAYFTGVDDEGNFENFTDNVSEVSRNAATAFGTGFFISRDGNIMTNRHVVRPEIDKSMVKGVLYNALRMVRSYFVSQRNEAEEEYNRLYYSSLMDGNDFEYDELNGKLAELKQAYEDYDGKVGRIESVSLDDVTITPSCRISIAYNGAAGTLPEDFHACSVTRVSGIDDVDLAVIQLNDRKTPKDKYVFHFAGGTKGKRTLLETYWRKARRDYKGRKLKPGTQLCMIGFNHGPQLAQTAAGIKAQISTGNILQEPDGQRLMYSIPLLQGSSGSPVLNMYGDVVGVNFAKLQGTTSFNFGIPLRRVKDFLGIDD